MNSRLEQLIEPFMRTILWSLVVLFVVLLISVIIRRIILAWRKKKFDESEKKINPLIYEYLDGEISPSDFSTNIETKFDIVTAFRAIDLMIDNLYGEEKEKLESLLELNVFKRYFYRKLQSTDVVNIAQACMYLEKKSVADKGITMRLQDLQYHSYTVVAYASTMALLNNPDSQQRDHALAVFMKRKNNASLALNDIIYEYITSHPDKIAAANELLAFISDKDISSQNSAAAVRVLPELGVYEVIDELVEIFLQPLEHDNKGLLTTAIIEVLQTMADRELNEEFIKKKTWHSPHENVRLATANWLQDNYSPLFEDVILMLVHDNDLEVRISAQKAMLHASNRKNLEKRLDREREQEWIEIKKTEKKHVDLR